MSRGGAIGYTIYGNIYLVDLMNQIAFCTPFCSDRETYLNTMNLHKPQTHKSAQTFTIRNEEYRERDNVKVAENSCDPDPVHDDDSLGLQATLWAEVAPVSVSQGTWPCDDAGLPCTNAH